MYATLEVVTLRARKGSATMGDLMVPGIQQDDSRDTITRDSLATLARRRSVSQENNRTEAVRKEEKSAERPMTGNAANDYAARESRESYEPSKFSKPSEDSESSENDDSTQILPQSFIPTATGRIRPVAGAFPAIQSTSQEKHAQLRRSIRSLSAGSLRRSGGDAENMDNAGRTATGNGGTSTPRIASSAPHYVN